MKNNITTIVWDWNGTLLDDVEVCISSMNSVLDNHNLPRITGSREYKEKFCFPVEIYYKRLGFDFSHTPFPLLAQEFIDQYSMRIPLIELNKNTKTVLQHFAHTSMQQIIISASQEKTLSSQTNKAGINHYFHKILGINNIYAKSKAEIAINWKKQTGLKGSQIVLIGDTLHDFEVSRHIGCKFIWYSGGHQELHPSEIDDSPIISSLSMAPKVINGL